MPQAFADEAGLRETYAPVLLKRKAARLRRETGDFQYQSKISTGDTPRTTITKALVRPTKMFFRTPTVFFFVVYTAMVYDYL
ncbi:hypothetical protein Z517_11529 [Fonsecaea pedrosoi CBS 271.37]|uniref:Uncharacterized protein n=1 Tax=Fonsecaea pedrosoi CBS 271.37 TaxID=1442368 RepID=A0A0D2GQQ2_9EURO|nr:uncharacterized protein Z517_11529 [Fonsecaea pedrosoi CBS 271.37]KIW74759.1 hypothetical protein Z517_11529 [Fonsecaea pedrosoi CBS 271.37]